MTLTYCKQPLVPLALGLAAGILAGDGFPSLAGWPGLCVCGTLMFMGWLCRDRHALAAQCCLLLAVVALGATLMSLRLRRDKLPLPSQPATCQAIITDEPLPRGRTVQADMELTAINGVPLKHSLRTRGVFLSGSMTKGGHTPHMGDGIEAYCTITLPESTRWSKRKDRHFDETRWMLAQGYRAVAVIRPYHWNRRALPLSALSRYRRMQMRMRLCRQQLLAQYRRNGMKGREYAVVAAMTLGYKTNLQPELRQVYAATGTSHVLALSGLHLTIVLSTLLCLLRLTRINRWVAYWLALLALWSYVALVGMPVSALRSAVTLTVCTVALLLHRTHASVSALSLAAIVLLTSNPYSLWDISFQLSFAAVLSIIIGMPIADRVWHPRHWAVLWLWRCACVSVVAQLGTQPLTLYYFGQASFYFLLSNMLVAALVYVILALSLCFFAATPLPAAQQLCATLLALATRLLNTGLQGIASLPGAQMGGIAFNRTQVALCYVALLSLAAAAHRLLNTYFKTDTDKTYWTKKIEQMKPKRTDGEA